MRVPLLVLGILAANVLNRYLLLRRLGVAR